MSIKDKVIEQLTFEGFPDLKFFYSQEVLSLAPEILDELLAGERKDFENKLCIKDGDISFETFDDFSYLDYFFGILEHYQWVHGDDTIRKIIEDFEPKYIDFSNEIAYSQRYYEMLKICISSWNLDNQQERILQKSIDAFELRGIALEDDKKQELKDISKRLSELSQKFSNNVVDSKKEFEYSITDSSLITEMPQDDIQVAEKKAQSKWKEWYLFDASQSSYMSILKYCSEGNIRRHFFESRHSFATSGKFNNKPLILETLRLRKRKSEILGFDNYTQLALKFKMAESPQQIIELFSDISHKAKPKAQKEIEEISEYFNIEKLENWDLSYYANKLREEKYSFDSKKLKEYFKFEDVLKWMFDITKRLYNIDMKKLDISSYHDDVEVYEVSRNGEFLSYFFTDYFYNDLKRPGAWANILREKFGKNTKLVLNVCNFQKWVDQTLLTLWDVETMFHEFGHATHEMLSRSKYSQLSGFHVEHDFVELPSQLLENWCRDREGMNSFARHYKSWESVPEDMFEKLQQLDTFWNGQMVLTQNTYAMTDMLLHSEEIPLSEDQLDKKVESIYDISSVLDRWEVYSPHTTFTHIFDGWYAAGYYGYMWAEIIEKEVWRAFKDSGDIFSPEVSQKFHDTILSAGTTKKASELFRDFFWRDVQIDAFLSEKGLV